jgi:hypothetical protein
VPGLHPIPKGEDMNLTDIEKLTKDYSDERTRLADRIRYLEDEINTLKRKRLPGIKNAVQNVVEKQEDLKSALEDSRPLFVRPKTVVFHGVKVGFQKSKGKLSWNDDAQGLKLIRKHFPDQEDILIKKTERPSKDALLNLSAENLKKIGVTISDTGDVVVIKSTDSEIDKFVEALLNEDVVGKEEAA